VKNKFISNLTVSSVSARDKKEPDAIPKLLKNDILNLKSNRKQDRSDPITKKFFPPVSEMKFDLSERKVMKPPQPMSLRFTKALKSVELSPKRHDLQAVGQSPTIPLPEEPSQIQI